MSEEARGVLEKALHMLKDRENQCGEEAHRCGQSYAVQASLLDRAAAFNTAWWIVQFAIDGNYAALEKMESAGF